MFKTNATDITKYKGKAYFSINYLFNVFPLHYFSYDADFNNNILSRKNRKIILYLFLHDWTKHNFVSYYIKSLESFFQPYKFGGWGNM